MTLSLEHLAARSYYVVSVHISNLFSCHHTPHRTVLALFTHTAPQQHSFLHIESYHRFTIIRGVGKGKRSSSKLNLS